LFVPKIALPHIDPLGQGTGRTLVSAAPPDIEILELVEIKARAFFQVGQRYLDGFGTFSWASMAANLVDSASRERHRFARDVKAM
jgi:hypothetical protein